LRANLSEESLWSSLDRTALKLSRRRFTACLSWRRTRVAAWRGRASAGWASPAGFLPVPLLGVEMAEMMAAGVGEPGDPGGAAHDLSSFAHAQTQDESDRAAGRATSHPLAPELHVSPWPPKAPRAARRASRFATPATARARWERSAAAGRATKPRSSRRPIERRSARPSGPSLTNHHSPKGRACASRVAHAHCRGEC